MPQSGVITDIIDLQNVISQRDQAIAAAEQILQKIESVNAAYSKIGAGGGGGMSKVISDESAATKEYISTVNQLTQTEAKEVQLKQNITQELVKSKQAYQDHRKELELNTKATNDELGMYDRLAAKREQAAKNLRNLMADEKANKEAVKAAAAEYDNYDKQVRKIGETMRNNQINVGTYTSAFNGLKSAFVAVTGAVAAAWAAIEAGKVIVESNMALHEQWRIATEGVAAAYKTLIHTFATGEGWGSLFTNMTMAIRLAKEQVEQEEKLNLLQFQTTLTNNKLKADATRLYETIFSTQDVDKRADAIKKYMELMRQVASNDKSVAEEKRHTDEMSFLQASKNLEITQAQAIAIAKMAPGVLDFYKKYNDKLQEQFNLQNPKGGAGYAKAGLVPEISDEDAAKLEKVNKELSDMQKTPGFNVNLVKQIQDFVRIGGDVENGIPKVVSDMLKYSDTLNTIDINFEQTTKSIQRVGAKVAKESEADADKALHKAQEIAKQAQALLSKYNIGGIAGDYQREVSEVSASPAFKASTEEDQQSILFAIRKKWGEKWLAEAEKQGLDQIKIEKQIIADKEALEKGIYDLLKQYRGESLAQQEQNEIDHVQSTAAFQAMSADQQDSILLAIDDKYQEKKRASDLKTTEQELDLDEKKKEAKKKELATAEDIFNALGHLADEIYNSKIASLEEEKTAVDDKFKAEYEAASGNAVKQKSIKDEQQKQDIEIDKQSRKMKHDQAVLNKALAAVNIIVHTAEGAAAQLELPVAGVALAALVIALGAVELAAVLATPVPGYAKGRMGGPETVGFTGEAGHELIKTRRGELFLTPDEATLTHLPEGARVYPHDETMAMLGAMTMTDIPRWNDSAGDISDLRSEVRGLHKGFLMICKTIQDKPETQFNWTENGVSKWVRSQQSWVEYLNRNVRC